MMERKLTHLEGTYIVKAPRDDVYRLFTDFEKTPEHFPAVAKSFRFLSRDGDSFTAEAQTKAFFGSPKFAVRMDGRFDPPNGFTSTNVSVAGVEHEKVTFEEVPEGTRIIYVNDVEIKNPFFRMFSFLISRVALRY